MLPGSHNALPAIVVAHSLYYIKQWALWLKYSWSLASWEDAVVFLEMILSEATIHSPQQKIALFYRKQYASLHKLQQTSRIQFLSYLMIWRYVESVHLPSITLCHWAANVMSAGHQCKSYLACKLVNPIQQNMLTFSLILALGSKHKCKLAVKPRIINVYPWWSFVAFTGRMLFRPLYVLDDIKSVIRFNTPCVY